MRIRGRRRCKDCDREWSYYDTASVACPNCGSLRSVGVGDRQRHTDDATELDLTPHRAAVDEDAVDGPGGRLLSADAADDLKSDLRTYLRRRGFVNGGDLRDLDDTYLAARELLHAADLLSRSRDPDEEAQLYVLSLLRGADGGDRPDPSAVPPSMTAARGLAYAESVDAYRRDVTTWLDDNPDPAVRTSLGTLSDHVKRATALEGDVPVDRAESMVRIARELAVAAREGDETALSSARDRLRRLG
jgi:hypothetical protein